MKLRSALLCLLCVLGVYSTGALAAAKPSKPAGDTAGATTFESPELGRITVYQPSGAPRSVVLFISGDGGWNLGVVDMARALAARGALVAGVDIRRALKIAPLATHRCIYPAAQFEQLAHHLEARFASAEVPVPTARGLQLWSDPGLCAAPAGAGWHLRRRAESRLRTRSRNADAALRREPAAHHRAAFTAAGLRHGARREHARPLDRAAR